jgi:hypothetical protein
MRLVGANAFSLVPSGEPHAVRSIRDPGGLLLDAEPAGAARYIERNLIDRGEMETLRSRAGL